MTQVELLYQIVKAPVVTEKATDDQLKRNAYTFRVPVTANKVEIREAIQKLFKVKVVSVNTLRITPKARRRGWVAGQTPDWKKAMVALRDGDTIEIL
ncbi:MAG: 50S ribosomal protein L23 [Planctomycetota bacterium]|nr:50S ribosomal protein L23 [Planctomycetota bacterium]